jgi:hypothetical protein
MKERCIELSSLDVWESGEALGGRLADGGRSAATMIILRWNLSYCGRFLGFRSLMGVKECCGVVYR